MKNRIIIVFILLLIVVGAGAFFGGMKYQQSKQSTFRGQFNGSLNQRTGNAAGLNRGGFRPVNGEIISVDNKSVTVKLPDGSSKIVLLSDKTEISEATMAAKEALKVGEKIAVFGTDNSDGSVNAQNIQINPQVNQRNLPSPSPSQ
jgi:hypothetical protein